MPLGIMSVFLLLALLCNNVLRHVFAGLLKMANPQAGIEKDYSFEPTVSILLPCYNEGQTVYDTIQSISNSNYPNDKFEIIARDDCSVDDSYEWMLKAQEDFTNIRIRVSRNSKNSGKARTVCTALHQSEAEVILSIDSDCIFHPEAIRELVVCFANPKIGGVGGVVGVRNVNDSIATKLQTFVYYTNFHMLKSLESLTSTVICISGCMFAIRRKLLLELEPILRERNFFGIEVNDGEDRFLTHQILLRGYGTVINTAAQCWTTVPNNLRSLFKQQIRWQRSGVRDFILTVQQLPNHTKLHPNALYILLIPTLGVLTSMFIMVASPAAHINFFLLAPPLLAFYAGGAAVFWLITRKYNPEQEVANPLTLALLPAWFIVARFVEVVAMFTLDSQDWGTRALSPEPEMESEREIMPMAQRDSEPEAIAVSVMN